MIRILDRQIADKIAAGEVIERPLSIVKELVENSIDAGATSITVELRNGGKSLIRITDNGTGIDESDVEIAFERHATGKISKLEDLDRIMTLGFRGEALASIAAISRVTLYTKTQHAVTGTKLELHAGRVVNREKAGINKGTTLIVEDVFYNTPARRKFMKSDAREASIIIELIQHLAIYYAGISFRLINNGKTVLSTLGDGNYLNTIHAIYPGKEFKNLIEINGHNVKGFISDPGTTKTNKSGQLFFLNGRIIRSNVIEKGITEGYGDRIFSGFPVAILFIEADPDTVDVNVHPSKREVKFLDSASVIDDIASAIRKVIKTENAVPQAQIPSPVKESTQEKTTQVDIKSYLSERDRSMFKQTPKPTETGFKPVSQPEYKNASATQSPLSKQSTAKPEVKVFDRSVFNPAPKAETQSRVAEPDYTMRHIADNTPNAQAPSDKPDYTMRHIADNTPDAQAPSDKPDCTMEHSAEHTVVNTPQTIEIKAPAVRLFDFENLKVAGYIFDAYIITQYGDNIFILDQHAAHERILYEKLITRYNNKVHLSQPIMMPFTLETTSSVYNGERAFLSVLGDIGYEIEDFGSNTFIVKGIPEYMDLSEAMNFARSVTDSNELSDTTNQIVIDKLIMRSCKSAVKANDRLSDSEINDLLSQLSRCINPFSCPHGRPTFIKMSRYDIERSFRRK